ncbi:hypothetical protein VSQ48_15250 [Candidatus Ventrimonas sp. KK005]
MLQESHYSLFPDEIYAKPRRVRDFMYASLELTLKERKEKPGGKAGKKN